ncbi:MAG TPA: isoprenylcysteine carboxylmethyltransferase family protein [Terriglobales bacterium]|nr:isoprenylcysteine carboxylmethyltransferase family protein [Terriglobales bacterium]
MPSWSRIAKRIRVPLGFVFAAVYIWLARPTWSSIVAGGLIAAIGVGIRALASGHVKKNAELTTTGPYAYSRNPLYVGSIVIGAGFAVAALNWWIVAGLALLFLAIYIPVIRSEEAFLRQQFPEFEDYTRRVPRFVGWPRNHERLQRGAFSKELYWKHREYNAAVGTLAMLAALAIKLFWLRQP